MKNVTTRFTKKISKKEPKSAQTCAKPTHKAHWPPWRKCWSAWNKMRMSLWLRASVDLEIWLTSPSVPQWDGPSGCCQRKGLYEKSAANLGSWPSLELWDALEIRRTASRWNTPQKYGPHGERSPSSRRSKPTRPQTTRMTVVALLLIWKTCGSMVAQRALIRMATSTSGPRARNPARARLLMRSVRSMMQRASCFALSCILCAAHSCKVF